jgi:hypothetical protein
VTPWLAASATGVATGSASVSLPTNVRKTQPLRSAVPIGKLANSIPSLAIPRVCEPPFYASGDLVIARRPRTR